MKCGKLGLRCEMGGGHAQRGREIFGLVQQHSTVWLEFSIQDNTESVIYLTNLRSYKFDV